MAGGVPMAVVRPPRIPPLGALAEYVVVLVDDGNASRLGKSGHAVESKIALGAHVMYGQNDQRGAVAVRAFPELVQREGREVQCVFVDGWQILCGYEKRITDALPRRWLPPIEQRGVGGSVGSAVLLGRSVRARCRPGKKRVSWYPAISRSQTRRSGSPRRVCARGRGASRPIGTPRDRAAAA